MTIETLRAQYPWPADKPAALPNMDGWFSNPTKVAGYIELLRQEPKVVLELGSWLGMSTKLALDNCKGTVIAIDHWMGSIEHKKLPIIPILYDTFLSNMWDYRERLIPIRKDTISGMKTVAEHQIEPDLILIDAAHEFDPVLDDINTAHALFPHARICGDDYDRTNKAVDTFARQHNQKVITRGYLWILLLPGESM